METVSQVYNKPCTPQHAYQIIQ